MTKSSDIAGRTTGIGSLPPEDPKAVLDRAFAVDIPYFPTQPALGENETMLGQGLAGFLEGPADFAPGLLWRLYLERLARDPRPWTKLQWVGPATLLQAQAKWVGDPERRRLLEEWLLKRAEFLLAEVSNLGKKVLLFLDEPGLLRAAPLESGRRIVEALRQRGALVGIHCCEAGDFDPFLDWPLDFLSFDFALASPWEDAERLWVFRHRGGRLALGVVPTSLTSAWHPKKEVERCRSRLAAALDTAEAEEVLRESLLTPACGLGLRSPEECVRVFEALQEFQDCLKKG
ncbi:MAG TPA: hypothetical protein VJR29_10480 [bacterium]|nr:hypothetical protein [bacterium]